MYRRTVCAFASSLAIATFALSVNGALASAQTTSAPTFKIRSAGKGPRAPLRYALQPGTTTMTGNIRVGMQMGNSKTHSIPMTLRMSVTFGKRSANGDTPYTFKVSDIRIKGSPTNVPASTWNKLTVSGTLNARGVTKNSQLATNTIPPDMRQALAQYQACMETAFVVFPRQALGVGATWDVIDTKNFGAPAGGKQMVVHRVTRFRLLSRRGSKLRLSMKSSVSAPPQRFNTGGSTMKINRLSGGGSGTITIDAKRFKPRIDMTTSTQVDIDSGSISLDMTSTQAMKVRSK